MIKKLWHKIDYRLEAIIVNLLDFMFYFIICEINKVKNIEIVRIYSSRIGHLCWNMDNYHNMVAQNNTFYSKTRVFILDKTISNYAILKMIKNGLPGIYIQGKLAQIIDKLIKVERWKKFVASWKNIHPNQPRLANTTKWISVPKSEIQRLSVKHKLTSKESVVFHNRDESYLSQFGGDGNFHLHRNFPFSDYASAISTLKKYDMTAIRIGTVVEEEYYADNLINLTGKNKDYWGDVTSVEISKFFVSGSSGISHLSTLLRKPHLYVNLIPFDLARLAACAQNSIFIPKKLRNLLTGKFLSLKESLDLFKDWSIHDRHFFDLRKIEVVNNSQEEINEAFIEMLKRASGNLEESLHQSDIRNQLEKVYNDNFSKYVFNDLGIQLSQFFVKQNYKWFFKS